MHPHILCIEDDPTIQAIVSASLAEYRLTFASSLAQARQKLDGHSYAAIIIDIELPDGDGIHFYSKIHQDQVIQATPVLFLSSQTDVSSKILALTLGAEDYITKPFHPLELKARVGAKIAKNLKRHEVLSIRRFGNVEVDFKLQKAFVHRASGTEELALTGLEFKIFSFLTESPDRVYTRDQIMDHAWGDTNIASRTVDSHIAHLRQKLRSTNITIQALKNMGYKASVQGS
jgi:DNA-binding response OmpR family regulator